MALKILIADDSMTAQNLGKKILTEAGYEVVAVSNGAAAVKKIAAEKPNIIILDVYMPGYSGLEVCEKVKTAAETASLPVLLTVGKMEPYQAEDGNRVRADGVMIKPFEASDLLAVVERFAKKAQPAKPADAGEKTVKMPAVEDFKDESYEAWKSEAPVEASSTASHVAMTAEVAAAPAFGFDEMAPAPAEAPGFDLPPVAPAPAFDLPGESASPAFEIPAVPEAAPAFDLPPVAEPAPAFDMAPNATEPAPSFGLAAEEPAPTAEFSAPPELEFNSAPPVEVAAAAAPELETTQVAAPPEVAIAQDPALVSNTDTDIANFAVKIGVENPEPIPVGIAEPQSEAAAAPSEELLAAIPVVEPEAEAAPAYQKTQPMPALVEPQVDGVPEVAPEPAVEHAVESPQAEEEQFVPSASALSLEEEMRRAFSGLPVESAPAAQAAAAAAGAVAASAPAMGMDLGAVASATGSDEDKVAQALDRVMERFKGQLVSEIVRELKKG